MRGIPKDEKLAILKAELQKINQAFPATVYIPLVNSKQNLFLKSLFRFDSQLCSIEHCCERVPCFSDQGTFPLYDRGRTLQTRRIELVCWWSWSQFHLSPKERSKWGRSHRGLKASGWRIGERFTKEEGWIGDFRKESLGRRRSCNVKEERLWSKEGSNYHIEDYKRD